MKLLTRNQLEELATSIGVERPWHSERAILETRLQKEWHLIGAELEDIVKRVIRDSEAEDEKPELQGG